MDGNPGHLFLLVGENIGEFGIGRQSRFFGGIFCDLSAPDSKRLDTPPRYRRTTGDPVAYAASAASQYFGDLFDGQSVNQRDKIVHLSVA